MRHLIVLTLASLAAAPALAVGRLADVSVIDRDTGETLTARHHRGEWWVEGRPGARYGIRVRNAQGLRVLAVTSVDGVNVLSGETAAADQRGYVFDPGAAYDITGWRKSDAQVAAFTFTSVPRSYAAQTGRPANVGVIGIALFRERPAPPLAESEAAADSSEKLRERSAGEARRAPAAAPALGTGHGAREYSRVVQVEFTRANPQPDEVIRVRYDSRANLVARGVIRETRSPDLVPDPFPAGPRLGYVPDP